MPPRTSSALTLLWITFICNVQISLGFVVGKRRTTSLALQQATTTSAPSDDVATNAVNREAWVRGFATVEKESCFEINGDFPSDLEGTLFQNGYAKFKVGDEIITHPFDADGMVTAITFFRGKAWFRNRLVETPGFLKELEENRVCFRGLFGTAKNKGAWYSNILDLNFKNVANTHVLLLQNKLYALWEGGRPFEMDPISLETVGESSLQDSIQPGQRYAAHYKVDPDSGNICNFSVEPGKKDPVNSHTMVVMEHSKTGELLYKKAHDFEGQGLSHDTAITKNYFCFVQPPVLFNPLPFILGLKGVAQCFTLDESAKHAQLHLIPRGDNGDPISIDIPSCFCFHMSNAFEDNDGTVVIDIIMADDMLMASTDDKGYPTKPLWETSMIDTLPIYQFRRYRVDPSTQQLVSIQSMSDDVGTVDFPIIHPQYVGKPYRYAYCAASPNVQEKIFSGLVKIDVNEGKVIQQWFPPTGNEFLSEVALCPRSTEEDDAYLIGYLRNGAQETTSVVVFDAANIEKGPIAQADLDYFLPHALHGTFVPGFTPELTDAVKTSFENIKR